MSDPSGETRLQRFRPVLIGLAVAALLIGGVVAMAVRTLPIRRAVGVYTALIVAANQQDLDTARRLCSTRYLKTHNLRLASEGGIVGFPRNINKNFQAWRQGPDIWVCPTDRQGPIYQFVLEGGQWRFDGPVGILRGRGQVVRYPDNPEAEPDYEGDARP
jgi:hypothetical protein